MIFLIVKQTPFTEILPPFLIFLAKPFGVSIEREE
jgi:hypothetical protein